MYFCAWARTALSEAVAPAPVELDAVAPSPAAAAALAQSPEMVDRVEYRKRDWISLMRLWTGVTPSRAPPRRRPGGPPGRGPDRRRRAPRRRSPRARGPPG